MGVLMTMQGALGLIASVLTILMFATDCVDRLRRRRERRKKMMHEE